MSQPAHGSIQVEAQLRAPSAVAQLVHYHFVEAPDSKVHVEDAFQIELCLNARHRSARACYSDQWSPHRFERVGDIFLVVPSTTMLARSDETSSVTSIVCQLAAAPVLELFDALPNLTDQQLLSSLDIRDSRVRGLLLRLAEEARQPGFASEMMVDLIARQIAVELVRLGNAITEGRISGGLAAWQLRRIDERLIDVGSAPTLPMLAALCRISVRQLTRGFRASRGCSIGEYVAISQMEHAKRLLAADMSVTAIGETLGFSSGSNFCFAFRRATGMTPGQFRKKLLSLH